MARKQTTKRRLISFIFPVYNNAGSLEPLYKKVTAVTKKLTKKYDYELLFVNDGSHDNSISVLKKLIRKDKKVRVYDLSRNFGHQAAVTAGLDNTRGDAVIIMDADLQDPPAVCLDLIAKWEEGYEVVYAQRRTRKDSFLKRFTARAYYKLLASISSVEIPRDTGDFRLVDRSVVAVIRTMTEYHRFLRGMFSYTGFKHIGVQFDRDERHSGKSEYTLKKMIKLAKDGIFGFSDVPLRAVSRLGYIVSGLSALGIIYALCIKIFWSDIAVPGWTMIVVSIFFMGGVQLVMLGFIGEYIGRIYNEVRNRPTYVIARQLGGGRSIARKGTAA